jgi:hypothetical protein
MKIGILTAFSEMLDHYSLTSVVRSQIKMIASAGHEPVLMVQDDFEWKIQETALSNLVEVRKTIPAFNKIDYMGLDVTQEHAALVPKIAERILQDVADLSAIFTHDLIFTGWNLPINLALQAAARVSGPYFHWVHSVPSGHRPYWNLPENSWLVYPNQTDRVRCAENFRTWRDRVLVVPHVVDLREFHVRTQVANRLITEFDVLGADLVQVYPIPQDRAKHKGVKEVIEIFGHLKALGKSVRLIFPNAWCNVEERKREVTDYLVLAAQSGLMPQEVIFTSQWRPDLSLGLSQEAVSDLALCGNLFVCPTWSETFGLSLAEAALSGCLLVLNENLPMLREVCGGAANAVWAEFGSFCQATQFVNRKKYLRDIAKIILHTFENSPELMSRTHYRQKYRREAVWRTLESAILATQARGNLASA